MAKTNKTGFSSVIGRIGLGRHCWQREKTQVRACKMHQFTMPIYWSSSSNDAFSNLNFLAESSNAHVYNVHNASPIRGYPRNAFTVNRTYSLQYVLYNAMCCIGVPYGTQPVATRNLEQSRPRPGDGLQLDSPSASLRSFWPETLSAIAAIKCHFYLCD